MLQVAAETALEPVPGRGAPRAAPQHAALSHGAAGPAPPAAVTPPAGPAWPALEAAIRSAPARGAPVRRRLACFASRSTAPKTAARGARELRSDASRRRSPSSARGWRSAAEGRWWPSSASSRSRMRRGAPRWQPSPSSKLASDRSADGDPRSPDRAPRRRVRGRPRTPAPGRRRRTRPAPRCGSCPRPPRRPRPGPSPPARGGGPAARAAVRLRPRRGRVARSGRRPAPHAGPSARDSPSPAAPPLSPGGTRSWRCSQSRLDVGDRGPRTGRRRSWASPGWASRASWRSSARRSPDAGGLASRELPLPRRGDSLHAGPARSWHAAKRRSRGGRRQRWKTSRASGSAPCSPPAPPADGLPRVGPEAAQDAHIRRVLRLLLGAAAHRPLVIAMEDLHWIDKTSEECLGALVDGLAAAADPRRRDLPPGLRRRGMDRKSYVTQLALPPLSPDDSLAVLRSALARRRSGAVGPRPSSPSARRQSLLPRGAGPGLLDASGARPRPAVPATIQGVLGGRIERLPEAKRLLQTAAVIGTGRPARAPAGGRRRIGGGRARVPRPPARRGIPVRRPARAGGGLHLQARADPGGRLRRPSPRRIGAPCTPASPTRSWSWPPTPPLRARRSSPAT